MQNHSVDRPGMSTDHTRVAAIVRFPEADGTLTVATGNHRSILV
jgi:hypothetical protein